MRKGPSKRVMPILGLMLGFSFLCTGCSTIQHKHDMSHIAEQMSQMDIPRELHKSTHPEYVIEAPDILVVEAVNNVRPASSKLEPGNQLDLRVTGTLPIEESDDEVTQSFKQINGIYLVENDDTVNLGPEYGTVKVAGMTRNEAKAAIEKHLKDILATPIVAISLTDIGAKQQVADQFLVMSDGTINLGIYGHVRVTGLTVDQAKSQMEQHLSRFMVDPEVRVQVAGLNSKVYYVITDGGGYGEQVYTFPITGNETVLDAISEIQGLPSVASKKDIWVARPAPAGAECAQILPVNWPDITMRAATETNYQLFPGDRVYVAADHFYTLDSGIAKVLAPIERIFGFTLFGTSTVSQLRFFHQNQGNGNRGGGGGF